MQYENNNRIAQPPSGLLLQMPKYGPPEIEPTEINMSHVLGDGSFGTVYSGKCRQKDVAIKVLHKQDWDEKTLNAFRHEVELMSKIFHPNINLFMGACTVPGNLMIVTELMRGDLETMLLEEQVNMSLLLRMRLARDAALGILWLHSSNPQIIHRDLKASNLLVDENLNCKVCDFGLSQLNAKGKSLRDGQDGAKGTPLWMAPEVMMGQPFNEKADVYSFALILWFLLEKKEPYSQYDELESFTHDICIKQYRPPISADADPSLRDLIVRCWDPDPRKRPGFGEIITRLENIIVDIAIEDQVGRAFWKKFFLTKYTVTWTEFLDEFARMNHLVPVEYSHYPISYIFANFPQLFKGSATEINLKCLKAILAEESKNKVGESEVDFVVTIEKFGNILKWFGPIVLSHGGIDENDTNLLHKIRQQLTEPWFHGDISTHESENMLLNKPEGMFLVRFSTSSPGCFTISKVSFREKAIKHQKIQHRAGSYFEINGQQYRTLRDLVQNQAQALELYTACPGSRYLGLFMEQRISGYVDVEQEYPQPQAQPSQLQQQQMQQLQEQQQLQQQQFQQFQQQQQQQLQQQQLEQQQLLQQQFQQQQLQQFQQQQQTHFVHHP